MQSVVLLGRQKRNQAKIKTKFPLGRLTVIHEDQSLLSEIERLEDYLKVELNVKEIGYETDESRYINLYAKPNSPVLGKRFGPQFKVIKSQIESLGHTDIKTLQDAETLTIGDETFSLEDILIFREAREGTETVSDRFMSIELDTTLTDALVEEGLAREVISRIQKLRKELGFNVTDRIQTQIEAAPNLVRAIQAHEAHVKSETLTTALSMTESLGTFDLDADIDGDRLRVKLTVNP
jgi:isoleucyl-tRNA synthetase